MTITSVGIKSTSASSINLNGTPDVPDGSSAPYTVKVWYSDGTSDGTKSATLSGSFGGTAAAPTFTPTTMPTSIGKDSVGILKLEGSNMLMYILIALALYYFLIMKKR